MTFRVDIFGGALIDEGQILLLRGVIGLGEGGLLCFFELFETLLEFGYVESLICVEVADLEGLRDGLFLLEDATDSLAAFGLISSLLLFSHLLL